MSAAANRAEVVLSESRNMEPPAECGGMSRKFIATIEQIRHSYIAESRSFTTFRMTILEV
jgi:hypothetical protein